MNQNAVFAAKGEQDDPLDVRKLLTNVSWKGRSEGAPAYFFPGPADSRTYDIVERTAGLHGLGIAIEIIDNGLQARDNSLDMVASQ